MYMRADGWQLQQHGLDRLLTQFMHKCCISILPSTRVWRTNLHRNMTSVYFIDEPYVDVCGAGLDFLNTSCCAPQGLPISACLIASKTFETSHTELPTCRLLKICTRQDPHAYRNVYVYARKICPVLRNSDLHRNMCLHIHQLSVLPKSEHICCFAKSSRNVGTYQRRFWKSKICLDLRASIIRDETRLSENAMVQMHVHMRTQLLQSSLCFKWQVIANQ